MNDVTHSTDLDNRLLSWLYTEAWAFTNPDELMAALVERLLGTDLSLFRLRITIRTLHPQMVGISYTWDRESGEVTRYEVPYSMLASEQYLNSPYAAIFDGAGGMRRRLEGDEGDLEFEILNELRARGVTDYVAMPFSFRNGQINAMTIATDRPGGFGTGELERIYDALPALGRVIESHAVEHMARTLLETYVGRQTGSRVLDGLVKRGDGEDIYAVIWFCDLRDSTPLADSMARADFVGILNEFFDCTAEPVLAHGGEVLRFIGDAVLAIFPIDKAADWERPERCPAHLKACRAAVAAGRDAIERLGVLNAERRERDAPPLGVGIAMHLGEVMYGNIGVPERLEFSVIGAAANEAARLQGLCKKLGHAVLASQEFTQVIPEMWTSVGRHTLRGVNRPREVFSLNWADSPGSTANEAHGQS